jgi:hypothetical protein
MGTFSKMCGPVVAHFTAATQRAGPRGSTLTIAQLMVIAALVLAAPSAAAQPQTQQFRTIGNLTGPTTASGTWTATGLVEATGTYTETFRLAGETIHAEKVLMSASGTIVIRTQALLVSLDSCTVTFGAGSWQIADATGAYAGLKGGGTPQGTSTSRANVCTGSIDVVHAGAAQD